MGRKNGYRYDRDQLQDLFLQSQELTEAVVVALYARQTGSEQEAMKNLSRNGKGFCPCDVKVFTSIALSLKSSKIYADPPARTACWDYLTKSSNGKGRLSRYVRQINEMVEEGSVQIPL